MPVGAAKEAPLVGKKRNALSTITTNQLSNRTNVQALPNDNNATKKPSETQSKRDVHAGTELKTTRGPTKKAKLSTAKVDINSSSYDPDTRTESSGTTTTC